MFILDILCTLKNLKSVNEQRQEFNLCKNVGDSVKRDICRAAQAVLNRSIACLMLSLSGACGKSLRYS